MFLNRIVNFVVEAWLAIIWKKSKDTKGGHPPPPHPRLLSFLLLLLFCPLCWSYLPPQIKRATQPVDLTLGPTKEAEALEDAQGHVAGGQGWVRTCKSGSSAKQGAPPAFASSRHLPSPSATRFLTFTSLTWFSHSQLCQI